MTWTYASKVASVSMSPGLRSSVRKLNAALIASFSCNEGRKNCTHCLPCISRFGH